MTHVARKYSLTNVEVEQFFLLEVSLQMLTYTDRAYSRGSTRKQQVTDFQRYKMADISNQVIDFEKHIRRASALYLLPVYGQVKIQRSDIPITRHRHKRPDSRRRIEPLAKFPRMPRFTKLTLKVARSKVDSYRQSVIVSVRKTRRDVFAQPVDAHHQFRFVMNLFGKIGDKKWFPIFQYSRIRFHKNYRLCIHFCMPQFFVVSGIVHSHSYNFHPLISLKFNRLNITAKCA